MARSTDSIEDIINATVERVTSRILAAIERALAEAAGGRATAERPEARRPAAGRRRRSRQQDLTRWVADKRARRVPNFVIEATGLDTKKKIVARFGESATFEKGKPLPSATSPAADAQRRTGDGEMAPPRAVNARPPVIRKAASARPDDRAR